MDMQEVSSSQLADNDSAATSSVIAPSSVPECGCKDKEGKAELESRVLFLERSLTQSSQSLSALEDENRKFRQILIDNEISYN